MKTHLSTQTKYSRCLPLLFVALLPMFGLLGGGPDYGERDITTEDQNANGSATKAETGDPSGARNVNRLNAPAQPIHGRSAAKDDVSSERE